MSDYERGYYYGLYKKRVYKDQILSQKLYGLFFAVMGIIIQVMVGVFEFIMASIWIIGMGIYLILTRKNYMKGE